MSDKWETWLEFLLSEFLRRHQRFEHDGFSESEFKSMTIQVFGEERCKQFQTMSGTQLQTFFSLSLTKKEKKEINKCFDVLLECLRACTGCPKPYFQPPIGKPKDSSHASNRHRRH